MSRRFVSELALDPGSIGEYLVNEVLREQPEPQRKLVIETSFLDEVTDRLADAVTGMTGCGEMLTGLARANAFVIPLDAAQHRYRYHELFAEILRYLLQRQRSEAIRILQERAAAWFEGSGDLGTPSTGPGRPATGTTSPGSWPAAVSRTRSCTARTCPASVCGNCCRCGRPRAAAPSGPPSSRWPAP